MSTQLIKYKENEAPKNNGGPLAGIGYVGEKLGVGFMQSVEGIWDYAAGGIADLFGADEWAEEQMKNDWFGDWYSHPEEWYNPSGGWKTAGDIAGGVGSSLPAIGAAVGLTIATGGSGAGLGASIAVKTISATVAGLGAAGNATKEAYRETGELSGKEYGYGALVGATEGGIEALTQGIGKGGGRVVKSVAKGIGKKAVAETAEEVGEAAVKSAAKQGLKKIIAKQAVRIGSDFLSEAAEEAIAEVMSPVYARLTYDPDAKLATGEEIAYAAFVGGMSGVLMGGAGEVVGKGIDKVSVILSGNEAIESGAKDEILQVAQRVTETENEAPSGYSIFEAIKTVYEKLKKSTEKTEGEIKTVTQKAQLGELNRMMGAARLLPEVERSAMNIVSNPEMYAERYRALGMTDASGKPLDVTSSALLEGIDLSGDATSRLHSLRRAISQNPLLTTLALSDVAGRLMLDTGAYESRAVLGEDIGGRAEYHQFRETATSEKKAAMAEMLGVESLDLLDYESFRDRLRAYTESEEGRAYAEAARDAKRRALAEKPNDKEIPHVFSVEGHKDGVYRFGGEDGIAILKKGDTVRIYDYATGNISLPLTAAELTSALQKRRRAVAAATATEKKPVGPSEKESRAEPAQPRRADAGKAKETSGKRYALSDSSESSSNTSKQAEASAKNKRITVGMSDAERAEILKKKNIVAPVYEGQADAAIVREEANLHHHKIGVVKATLERISEEFGIIGKEINIEDVDVRVTLSKSNIGESLSKKATPVQIAKLLPILKETVEASIGIESHTNRYYYDTDTLYFDNLLGGYIDGEDFVPVRFGLKYSATGKATLYVVVDQNIVRISELDEIKKDTGHQAAGPDLTESRKLHRRVNYSLSQVIQFVNSKDLLRYLPDEMLDEKQRTLKWEGIAETITNTNSKNDKKYAEFIAKGNLIAAKQMVLAAAKAAGYTEFGYGTGSESKVYHNTEDSVKLAAITYDDNGDIIPLSQRFNLKNPDARFALPEETDSREGGQSENRSAERSATREEPDAFAKENVKEYEALLPKEQREIRALIRQARAHSYSDAEITTLARVSARSHVRIIFSKERALLGKDAEGRLKYTDGYYDPKANEIVINPEGKRSTGKLLMHELCHALYGSPRLAKALDGAVRHMNADRAQDILDRYREEGRTDIMELFEELSVHHAEDVLGNQATLDRLLRDEPTLGDKILSFLGLAKTEYRGNVRLSRAAGRLYRHFETAMDTLSVINQGNLTAETVTRTDPKNMHVSEDGRRYAASDKYTEYDKPITAEDIAILRSIGRKSINEFTSEDIKKAQKWAYKFYQEMGVKSPFFRAWFGDWRAHDTKTKIPVIPVNAETLERGEVPRGDFSNEDTGWSITSNSDGIDETANKEQKRSDSYHALKDIDNLLRHAVLLDTIVVTEPSKRLGKSAALMHHLYCPVSVNGKNGVAKLYIAENLGDKHKFYLMRIEKASTAMGFNTDDGGSTPHSNAATIDATVSIAQIFDFVKEHDADFEKNSEHPISFRPKPVNEQLLNEDGTPKVFYHGTDANFHSFDPSEIAAREGSFFFAENREDAAAYGKNIYEVYLTGQKLADYDNQPTEFYKLKSKKEQVAWLKKHGYDGWYADMDSDGWGEVSVFSPEQIKSATDNIGTFDAANPDIRFALPDTTDAVGKEKRRYQPSKKDAFFTAKDRIYIETVDELYGATKYLRKFGGLAKADAEARVQQARVARSQAQTMIDSDQYNVFLENPERMGDGLLEIYKPTRHWSEAKHLAFEDYLLHQLNVDRMTLESRSREWAAPMVAALETAEAELLALETRQKELQAELGKTDTAINNAKVHSGTAKLAVTKRRWQAKAEALMKRKSELTQELRSTERDAKAKRRAVEKQRQELKALELKNSPVFGKNDTRDHDVTAEESREIVKRYEEKYPEFASLAKKIYGYLDNLEEKRITAGLTTRESVDHRKKLYPHYVPSYRDVQGGGASPVRGKNTLEISSTLRRAKGGGQDILRIADSIAAQTDELIKAGQINILAREIYDAAKASGDDTYVKILSEESVKEEQNGVIELSKDSELAKRIAGVTGSAKYRIIQGYILEAFADQTIMLNDGKTAIVDKSDALHIANKSGGRKSAQIAKIKELVENAQLYAEENNVEHNKFNYFCYYKLDVSYEGEVFPVYLNVGRAKNDGTYHIYDVTQKIRDTANRINGFERPKPNEGYAQENDVSTHSIPDSGEKINLSDEISSEPDIAMDEILRPKPGQLTFYKDGKKITMEISKELQLAFEALRDPSVDFSNPLAKAAAAMNTLFKRGVTSLNPAFLIRNPIRDAQDAGINTRHPAQFAKFYATGIAAKEMLTNSKDWRMYRAMGGFSSTVFEAWLKNMAGYAGFESFVGTFLSSRGDGSALAKALKTAPAAVKAFFTGVENVNAFVEQVTRFAEFKASLAAGDSAAVALNNSAEVTTNFGRRGKLTKKLNATIMPFLNPAIQGFDKIFRNVSDAVTGGHVVRGLSTLLVKVAIVGVLPMLFNALMYEDDEDYEKLRETDKENYFLIKTGDGTFIKIPRGRLASVIGGAYNRGAKLAKGEDADIKGYLENVKTQVTPVENFSRTIFSPIFDIANNRTWYGGEIEGREFDDTAPRDRYDESTSSIAVALGRVFNYSPKKIHYLLDQYSGVVGDFVLPATTQKEHKDFFSGNFTLDSVTNNKLSDKFYTLYDETRYAKTAGDEEAAYRLKYLNKVKQSVSELNKEIEAIRLGNLSGAEKLQRTRVVRALINAEYDSALKSAGAVDAAIKETATITDETLRFAEVTRRTFGAECAIEWYDKKLYEKCAVLNTAGIGYDELYAFYFATRDLENEVDKKGNVIEGSKRKKVVAAINALRISTEQKLVLLASKGYTVKDGDIKGVSAKSAKQRLLRYIVSRGGSTQAEKAALAKACGFRVSGNRILQDAS